MSVQFLRGGIAVLSVTALSVVLPAHAVLPTPTETNVSTGEISYTANPNTNPNAPTLNTPATGRLITVTPQNTPINNPLGQTAPQNPSATTIAPPATTTQITTTPIYQTITTPQTASTAPAQTSASTSTSSINQPSHQSPSVGINSVVNAFIVQNENGQETLVPVNVGTPVKTGDVLEYQGLFTNHSADRVRSMDVTLTIADGLELVGGIHPRFPYASIDGNRFVRSPIRANIGGQVQELPLSEYKALRWTVEDIGLGGTAVVKYRAKVK